MNKPETLTMSALHALDLGKSVVWTLPRFVALAKTEFSFPVLVYPQEPSRDLDFVIVVGGGTLIDLAKIWKYKNNPAMKLVAVPSIWGSGAENSPIVVLNIDGKKVIETKEEFLPNIRVVWDKLAESLTPAMVKSGCADVWAHALEGFLSPIAAQELRVELGQLIAHLLSVPIVNTSEWFELSAQACAGQARSSVGLIHGIAHTIEGPLKKAFPNERWGHAEICAALVWPVMKYNMRGESSVSGLFKTYSIDLDRVMATIKGFFDEKAFEAIIPVIGEHWTQIIRNPLSRINCTLVRPNSLSYFLDRGFYE